MSLSSNRIAVVADDADSAADLVAGFNNATRCAVAMTLDPIAELRLRAVRMLAQLLRQDGFAVALEFGAAAVSRVVTGMPPDAVVFDLYSEDPRWIAAASYVRSFLPSAAIFFVTSHPESFHRRLAALPARVTVLEKPLNYDILVLELRRSLTSQSGVIRAVRTPGSPDQRHSKASS